MCTDVVLSYLFKGSVTQRVTFTMIDGARPNAWNVFACRIQSEEGKRRRHRKVEYITIVFLLSLGQGDYLVSAEKSLKRLSQEDWMVWMARLAHWR